MVPRRRRHSSKLVVLVVIGAGVQLLLSVYYLGAAHSPRPRDLPVGYISPPDTAAQVARTIDDGGLFTGRPFATTAAMIAAIERKDVYGGVDVSASPPSLYVATAAGPSAATALRTAFRAVVEQQVADRVAELVAAGTSVPPATVTALTTPATEVDVVPLPPADRAGSSLGLLLQALALGATIASLGLGRIGAGRRRSLRRGVVHVGTLVVYAVVSAAAVLAAARLFGVTPRDSNGRLFLDFSLVSLAITGSVAGIVSLAGPSGALVGTLYFVVGLVVSGAGIPPDFLPGWAHVVGQLLPTGAGATAIRDSLYFPAASIAGPLAVLSAYAAAGLVVVLLTNTAANLSARRSLLAGSAPSSGPEGD